MQKNKQPILIVLALIAVLLAGSVFIFLQSSNPTEENGILSGYVADAADNAPLKGVTVTGADQSGTFYEDHENTDTTGTDGFFSLKLPPNDYKLRFEADGYQPFISTAAYTVKRGDTLEIQEPFRLVAITLPQTELEPDTVTDTDADEPFYDTVPTPLPEEEEGGQAAQATPYVPASPAAGLSEDVLYYRGHSYCALRTSTIESFWQAQSFCSEQGGYLAIIDDAAENKALYDFVFYECGYDSAYFGLTDDGSEGKWYWIDGTDANDGFTNWLRGQPDNQRGMENYALFYYKDTPYKWNDGDFGMDAAGTVTFLIEWDYQ